MVVFPRPHLHPPANGHSQPTGSLCSCGHGAAPSPSSPQTCFSGFSMGPSFRPEHSLNHFLSSRTVQSPHYCSTITRPFSTELSLPPYHSACCPSTPSAFPRLQSASIGTNNDAQKSKGRAGCHAPVRRGSSNGASMDSRWTWFPLHRLSGLYKRIGLSGDMQHVETFLAMPTSIPNCCAFTQAAPPWVQRS